jgi:hypothetical protein
MLSILPPGDRYQTVPTAADFILSLWGGTWLVGMLEIGAPAGTGVLHVDPTLFWLSLANVAALLFAVSGYTIGFSARPIGARATFAVRCAIWLAPWPRGSNPRPARKFRWVR